MGHQILYLFPQGCKKILTMSYDDGLSFDRRLVELFNQYGIRGTFHLNSSSLKSGDGKICETEAADLYKGHEISVHTVTHPMINQIPVQQMVQEIWEDKKALEAIAGYPVRGMSYPYGVWNSQLVQALPALGMEYARTTASSGSFDMETNFMLWKPTCHHNDHLLERADLFLQKRDKNVLFYVWGHSYEFDRDNNWDLIESFCQKMAHHEEIWYATNIEIVEYLSALQNLRISADASIIYNPSCLSLWLKIDGQICCITAGETLKI